MSKRALVCHPIGYVDNEISPGQDVRWEEIDSRLVIEEKFSEALEGIEGFSHLFVIFWLHAKEGEPPLKVHPEQREDMPLVGVLATRAPMRPNPIGLTAVQLLKRRGNVLLVKGLDAYHGTPILDLKPYLPRGDSIPEARVPGWIERLWESL